jgi:bacillopeptidase F (M6 metalloprotease family)
LGDNYPQNADSRAVSPAFVVPVAAENPRLRFWHWFAIWGGDRGFVEVQEVGTSAWVQISPDYSNFSGAWTYPLLDLSAYAGKTIRVGFHIYDDGGTQYYGGPATISSGWYIDDVTLVTGAETTLEPNVPDDFEGGLGDWSAERGVWEVGKPTSGPGAAHSGSNCLATVLGDNYPQFADSRAISPAFVVPAAVGNPGLRFWHWFAIWGGDRGFVEVQEVGTSAWVQISPDYSNSSGAWTYPLLDLSAYAGKTIRVGFHIYDDGGTQYYGGPATISSGWYIDDVTLVTG